MDERELKAALEAIIFASGEPVPAGRISLVLGVPEAEVYSCAEALAEEYEREGRGFRLVRLDKSLQMCSAPQYAKAIARAIEHRAPPKLSPPAFLPQPANENSKAAQSSSAPNRFMACLLSIKSRNRAARHARRGGINPSIPNFHRFDKYSR